MTHWWTFIVKFNGMANKHFWIALTHMVEIFIFCRIVQIINIRRNNKIRNHRSYLKRTYRETYPQSKWQKQPLEVFCKKKVFLKISQILQWNSCVGVSFWKRYSDGPSLIGFINTNYLNLDGIIRVTWFCVDSWCY